MRITEFNIDEIEDKAESILTEIRNADAEYVYAAHLARVKDFARQYECSERLAEFLIRLNDRLSRFSHL